MTHTKIYLYGAIILAISAMLLAMSYSATQVGASVSETSEYMATTTAANSSYGAITTSRAVKTGTGTFGSFVITGANTGIINFYDATTTNVSLRTGNAASSTILIASFPASVAAGTYTFDVRFTNGLLVSIEGTALAATSTITYR